MEKLGVSAVKLKEATQELEGDRCYVRTEEREKLDKEKDKKKKAKKELKEKELKKQKVISVGKGAEGGEDVEFIEGEGEETYDQKLARQQCEIINQYETLLQQQNHLIEQEQILAWHKEQQKQQQQQQQQQWQEWSQWSTTVKQKPSTSGGAGQIDK